MTPAQEIAHEILAEIRRESLVGRWLTMDEACRYMKIKDRATVRKLIIRGDIDGTKTPVGWRIERATIDKYFMGDRTVTNRIVRKAERI